MNKLKKLKTLFAHVSLGILFSYTMLFYVLVSPPNVDRAAISNASATLSNPRRSFYGSVNEPHTANDTTITIGGTAGPDATTQHLFPGDTVSVGPNPSKTVSSVTSVSGTTFAISTGLTVDANANAPVYVTQSGVLSVSFTNGSVIPAGGYVKLTIPDPVANGNDGEPDTGSTSDETDGAGFDLNTMTIANTATSGGTGCTWGTTEPSEVLTAGTGAGHTFKNVTSTACSASGTIVMTIGDATKGLINPARLDTPTAYGTADIYKLNIETYGDDDILIETTTVAVAVVEGVLVSASIDETLSFIVAGRTGAACGATSTITTTPTAVPWGVLATAYAPGTHNASQQLTVSTNANSGYKVYVQQNDQMGLNGNVCDGVTPSSGDYTFGSNTCIRDTVCDSTGCTQTTLRDWGADPSSYPGLGYSLQNQAGTDAKFLYNASSASFNAKQFADKDRDDGADEEDETATNAEIMTNAGPVAGSSA
jgi:hypothetical protein